MPMSASARRLSHLYVFPKNTRPRLAREHVAVLVGGAEFRSAARSRTRIAALVEDEILHPAVLRVADPNPLLEAWILDIVGFGIEHVDQVVVVDRERVAARHAELVPPCQKLSVLVEDLDAGIGAVADEQPAALVHGDAVRD